MPKKRYVAQKTYDKWADIIYKLHFELYTPRSQIIEWFNDAGLTPGVYKEVVYRLIRERPDDLKIKFMCWLPVGEDRSKTNMPRLWKRFMETEQNNRQTEPEKPSDTNGSGQSKT